MSVDVVRARVAFRDRAFLDVLDLALRFTVVHARLYGKLALVVLVPAIALAYGVAQWAGWVAGWLTVAALTFAAQVPFTVLASRVVFAAEVRAREVLLAALRDMPRVFVMRVLWVGALALSTLLFIAPGMGLVATIYGFTSEVLLLERAPVGQSFTRSSRVAATSVADALLSLLVALLAPALGVLFAEVGGRTILGDLLMFRPPASAFAEGGSLLALIGWFGILPFATTARFFVYLNIRTRAEGWDIQTRFAEIASRAELAEAG